MLSEAVDLDKLSARELDALIESEDYKHEDNRMPSILVMNKVDLVTSKRRFKTLQAELEEIGKFDKVFYVSTQTGFGIDELKHYLLE